ncbi:hypothetical protein [Marinomonas sp. GJ51-6]|uniref:hypothetical protein n=1 Tax=Marinomonas sp. GJ51-6 TaxID=2992802 RepID=UPI002934E37B|nr:hypothetical protein [Marinomonas sp. GJ51-6]WOD09033.1 hypothetical protein ONZ50_08405 [Marinomonas sp. GJ51-6]
MQTSSRSGVFYALSAFILWAITPIYFKEMSFLPATEILSHRIIWSCLIVLVLILILGYGKALKTVIQSPKALMAMTVSTVLIAINWGTFI